MFTCLPRSVASPLSPTVYCILGHTGNVSVSKYASAALHLFGPRIISSPFIFQTFCFDAALICPFFKEVVTGQSWQF